MKLRRLECKDATFMLEWMKDESVTKYLRADFANKTIDDCYAFIRNSWEDASCIHLAIVDENDTYMGTVSLKNISDKMAEFAIAIRSCAMGQGYSAYGMREIIRIGLEEKGINQIYWFALSENIRAIKFYEKCGYQRTDDIPVQTRPTEEEYVCYIVTKTMNGVE